MPESTEMPESQPDIRREFGDFMLGLYKDHLSRFEVVYIEGLGYFCIISRPSRKGVNPLTGEVLTLPATKNIFRFTHILGWNEYLKDLLPSELEKKHVPFFKTSFPRLEELQRLIEGSKNADKPFDAIIIRTDDGELLKIKAGKAKRNIRLEDGTLDDTERDWLKVRAGDYLKELIGELPRSTLTGGEISIGDLSDE